MIYLLNSPVLTAYGHWHFSGPLSLQTARKRLNAQPVTSAVGHAASAALLTKLLARPVEVRRVAVQMHPGDEALVLRLLDRLPEGMVLDEKEIAAMPYELGWLRYDGHRKGLNPQREPHRQSA